MRLQSDHLTLTVTAAQAGMLDCALYAINGKLLRRWDVSQKANLQRHVLAFSGAAGLYLLRVTAADGNARVVRIMKEYRRYFSGFRYGGGMKVFGNTPFWVGAVQK